MENLLNIFQFVFAILIVLITIFQKTSADSLSGLSSNSNLGGTVQPKVFNRFMFKLTIAFIALFLINSIALSAIKSKNYHAIHKKFEQTDMKKNSPSQEEKSVPLAK